MELPDWVNYVSVDSDFELNLCSGCMEYSEKDLVSVVWNEINGDDKITFGVFLNGFADFDYTNFDSKDSQINLEEYGYIHLPNLELL